MGFEETVIDLTDMGNYSLKIAMSAILKEQAEISFKAGREYEHKIMISCAVDEGNKAFKDGRRNVVEWFMRQGGKGPIRYTDGVKARFDPNWDELQSKLKDWGIDPNGTEKPHKYS